DTELEREKEKVRAAGLEDNEIDYYIRYATLPEDEVEERVRMQSYAMFDRISEKLHRLNVAIKRRKAISRGIKMNRDEAQAFRDAQALVREGRRPDDPEVVTLLAESGLLRKALAGNT
ncbi:hypothetical protein KIPB_012817, partial [Kipferlia bialata]